MNDNGTVVAALLPLTLALMAILAATGLVAFTSHLSGETTQASSVMLCIADHGRELRCLRLAPA